MGSGLREAQLSRFRVGRLGGGGGGSLQPGHVILVSTKCCHCRALAHQELSDGSSSCCEVLRQVLEEVYRTQTASNPENPTPEHRKALSHKPENDSLKA